MIELFLTILLMYIAYYKKALTNAALILSGICTYIITLIGGIPCFLMIAITFLLPSILKLFFRNNNKVFERRNIIQIIVNVLPATIMCIIYYITKNNLFLLGTIVMIGETLSDTMGSDIGIYSKNEPINIITFKKSVPGLSGNVSILGVCSSFLGALIIALIYYIFINNSNIYFILIIVSSMAGSIFDSVIGSLLQVKYKCIKCKKITEEKIHCGSKTIYYKGIKWINNNMVNLFSNIFSLLLFIILY